VIAEVLPWQWLLNGLGWLLAELYDLIPNYVIAIILLTVLIKVVLFPLQWKQIRSMQHMQALQPKIKELQKKYKNNKQKQQEETMKLYREAGVNPLGGCLPMILLYPFLIAMYSVLRPVVLEPSPVTEGAYQVDTGQVHIPLDSALFHQIVTHGDTDFLFMNLQCTMLQAGTQVPQTWTDPDAATDAEKSGQLPNGAEIVDPEGNPLQPPATTQADLNCGDKRIPDAIPYTLLLAVMVASAFYMQRQTQKASPPGAQTGSQQQIMKYMPLMFAFFGINFPAGLVLYWTSSNLFQIAQQTLMLRAGHIGPDAIEKRMAEQKARAASGEKKESRLTKWMSQAEEASARREQERATKTGKPVPGSKPGPGPKPKGSPPPKRGAQPGNQLKKKPKPPSGGGPE
jgi:YidC/Oxa1 family membrane protein insertase